MVLDKITKESTYIRKLISDAHSFSRKRDLSYDSFEIEQLETLLKGREFIETPSLIDFYEYVEKYDEGLTGYFLEDLYNNCDFYFKQANNAMAIFSKSRFDLEFHKRDYSKKNISFEEAMEILNSFLSRIDENFYKYFIEMVQDERIITSDVFDKSLGIDGKCFFVNTLRKSYVVSGEDYNTFANLSLLVHELGHAYEFRLLVDKNLNQRQGIYATNLCEVSSTFFEHAFIKYLEEERIAPIESHHILDRYIYLIFEQFVQNYIVLSSPKFTNGSYFIDIDEEEFRSILKKLNEKYKFGFTFDNPSFNINGTLVYGNSMLLSLGLYELFKQDPKEFMKNFSNILMCYGLTKDNNSYEKIGISEQDMLKCTMLRKEINAHKKQGVILGLK